MTGAPEPIPDDIWHAAFDWTMRIDSAPDDPALAAMLQEWLSASPYHARAYAQVRDAWAAGPHLTPAFGGQRPPSRPHPANARPVFAAERRIGRREWLAGASAMAAGLALFAGSGGAQRLLSDVSTATGEQRSVTLEDSTRVLLDTATAMRIDFAHGDRRTSLLGGRAFFDVAHDAGRPFAVTAGPARVTVLGTRFDVRLDPESVRVTVEDGRVAVGLDGRILTPGSSLAQGDSLRIDLTTGAVRKARSAPGADTAWRDGRLEVDDWSVAQVLSELDRYHRGVILVSDPAFGGQRISGSFDLRRPEQAARSVAQAQGGQVRRISPWVLLVSPS